MPGIFGRNEPAPTSQECLPSRAFRYYIQHAILKREASLCCWRFPFSAVLPQCDV